MTAPLRRRALLIGTEHHQDRRFDPLPSTRADTAQLAEVLGHRSIGAFEVTIRSDLRTIDMREMITAFFRERATDELALLYISGHGTRVPGGEFVFVAADTDADRLDETAMTAGFVNTCLEDCWSVQKVAILDCCRSGGFAVGFRTGSAKSVREQPLPPAPLTPRGVYVLSSSDVAEDSYAGGGTVAEPKPSVFTAAIIETLRTGSAGTAASGLVSVDDLFDAVSNWLQHVTPRQTPIKSALGVSGRFSIAARPLGGAPHLATPPGREAQAGPEVGVVPGWPALLAYYRDAVRAESGELPLLEVRGGEYVCLPDRERVLSGNVDDDDCIPMPPGAEQLVAQASADNGPELWVGWPSVVLHGPPGKLPWPTPRFAPLLMRQVEVVTGEATAPRLRPVGPAVPHPGLVTTWLGAEEAELLVSSYQPTWHGGESARMAEDAGHLLRDDFRLAVVEELRPDQLTDHVDATSPGAGARNASVLFAVASAAYANRLLRDLDRIIEEPAAIAGSALAALLPGAAAPRPEPLPPLVIRPIPPSAPSCAAP